MADAAWKSPSMSCTTDWTILIDQRRKWHVLHRYWHRRNQPESRSGGRELPDHRHQEAAPAICFYGADGGDPGPDGHCPGGGKQCAPGSGGFGGHGLSRPRRRPAGCGHQDREYPHPFHAGGGDVPPLLGGCARSSGQRCGLRRSGRVLPLRGQEHREPDSGDLGHRHRHRHHSQRQDPHRHQRLRRGGGPHRPGPQRRAVYLWPEGLLGALRLRQRPDPPDHGLHGSE